MASRQSMGKGKKHLVAKNADLLADGGELVEKGDFPVVFSVLQLWMAIGAPSASLSALMQPWSPAFKTEVVR
jgi:hypothetical protein